jgi:hypothetical protein
MGKNPLKLSDSDSELTITNAFLGASQNLFIIEKQFSVEKTININQYINYLSLLALCLELGLKNIIKNTNKVWNEHDLEKLFNNADMETNNCFSKKFFGSYSEDFKNGFIALLKNVKYLYIEMRYCYGDSLSFFIDDKYITNENMINFDKIKNSHEPYIALILFLQELGEYHDFIHKNSIGKVDLNKDINNYLIDTIRNKFEIQENIGIIEK